MFPRKRRLCGAWFARNSDQERDFDRLVASIRQAGKIRRGEMKPGRVFEFAPADVKSIRQRLGKSQQEFALMIGVTVTTLQDWEQGKRRPEGPARALLRVAAANPEVVSAALGA
jgi:putative transcriptional regulator